MNPKKEKQQIVRTDNSWPIFEADINAVLSEFNVDPLVKNRLVHEACSLVSWADERNWKYYNQELQRIRLQRKENLAKKQELQPHVLQFLQKYEALTDEARAALNAMVRLLPQKEVQ